jgi:hypothetical protein
MTILFPITNKKPQIQRGQVIFQGDITSNQKRQDLNYKSKTSRH